jgi:response regulator NasT
VVENDVRRLRVLIANEQAAGLDTLAAMVAGLGHEVVSREVDIGRVSEATARGDPDVALVELGPSTQHALDLIEQIVHEAACPVIALLSIGDPVYVQQAAKLGVFAAIVNTTPEELQNAIDITLHRFGEYHKLQGAFGRRAVIEQAKGILMARQSVSSEKAFTMLREQSQRSGQKLADVATALVNSHLLLPPSSPPSSPED